MPKEDPRDGELDPEMPEDVEALADEDDDETATAEDGTDAFDDDLPEDER